MSEANISKSKQKRMQQENARKEQKKVKAIRTFWCIFIPVLIVAAIVGCVFYYKSLQVNYEKGLNKDGTVANIDLASAVNASYDTMSFSKSELMPSDSTIQSDIDSVIDEHGTLNSDSSRMVEFGDKVHVTYTGTADGEVVDSADESEGGEDIVIGDSDIAEEVDDALYGKYVGESVEVAVNYEEDYYDDSLAGKAVTYVVNVLGAYDYPEFNDEFVQANLSDVATTAEGYRESITKDYYENNLKNAIDSSISLNCAVLDYPEDYLDNVVKITKEENNETFEYYKSLYQAYGLDISSPKELYGLETDEEYDAKILDDAKEKVMKTLFCQYVFEKAGLTNTEEEVKTYLMSEGMDEATYSQNVSTYGYKYLANQAMEGRVMNYLMENVTITE